MTLVSYIPNPTCLAPYSLGPPRASMDLGKKRDRKRIILPVPDVAHKRIIKEQNEPLLDQHFLALF